MNPPERVVVTVDELIAATKDPNFKQIILRNNLANVPTIRLLSGQSLRGDSDGVGIIFIEGVDGIRLSSDNQIHNIRLQASPEKRAIFNDTNVDTLGRIELHSVTAVGQVQILARGKIRGGHVDVKGLDIISADARRQTDRPKGYGVNVLQGAFTLWNQHSDPTIIVTAELKGISAGRDHEPVLGSGVFVSGGGDKGGRLNVTLLETGEVFSNGKIAPGTPDMITGGVFVAYGTHANEVRNRKPLTTYGVNDMVLDNWGVVDRWIAEEKITSHGPSGIGFVNFGTVKELKVNAPIETFGQGARGFNVYTGTVDLAEFDRIVTHADGAVGIQISQPIGRLVVHRGIETFGGTGPSLVKGVVVTLSAIGLSIKAGGSAHKIDIIGGIKTNGSGVTPIELHGTIELFRAVGGLSAAGGGFDKI